MSPLPASPGREGLLQLFTRHLVTRKGEEGAPSFDLSVGKLFHLESAWKEALWLPPLTKHTVQRRHLSQLQHLTYYAGSQRWPPAPVFHLPGSQCSPHLYRYPGKASLICHLGKSMKCLGAITSIKVNFQVKEETKRKKIRKEGRRGKPELEILGDNEGLCARRVGKPWCRLSGRPMVWVWRTRETLKTQVESLSHSACSHWKLVITGHERELWEK